jgi:thymidylate synthase (FAD)
MRQFLMTERKYLEVTKRDETLLITASVRGWREYYSNNPACIVARAAINILAEKYPVLFGDFDPADTFHAQAVLLADIEDKFYGKHKWVAGKVTVNRAVSHEIVRHRPCGILQASQRYIRYEDEVTFIKPMFFDKDTVDYEIWKTAMSVCEGAYQIMLEKNNTPQSARTVLPNSTATSLIVYANLNEWDHIFRLRTSSAAEPSMREIMVPCYEEFKKRCPEVIK